MAQEWKGTTRGNLLGYKIFVWALKNLGLDVCYFMLLWVSLYFVFFSPKSGFVLFKFYRNRIGFSFFKSLFYIWKNYYFLGQSLIDKVAFSIGMHDKFTLIKPQQNELLEMINQEKACVFIMTHLGNFEAAGKLVRLPKKINMLMYAAEIEAIKSFMDELGNSSDFKAFTIKYDGSHIFELAKVLENNEILCLHGDRYLEGSKTLKTNFFSQQANFPYGPFYLSNRFKANAALVSLVKSGRKEYTLEFRAIESSKGSQRILEGFSEELEKLVLKYPESWFNYHDFWKNNENVD